MEGQPVVLSLNLDDFTNAGTLSLLQNAKDARVESLQIQSTSQNLGHMMPAVWKDSIVHLLEHSSPQQRQLRQVLFQQRSDEDVLMARDFAPFAVGLAHKDCAVSKLTIRCELDEHACAMLVDLLRSTSCSIRELEVTVRDSIYPSVLQGLLLNSSVHSVSLSNGFVGLSWKGQSDPLLSDLLKVQHCSLRTLNLHHFFSPCIPELFQAVANNTTLTSLGVFMEIQNDDSLLDDDEATEILRALQVNSTLTKFQLDAHITSRSVAGIIFDAVKSTKAKTYLYLTNGSDDDDDDNLPTLISLAARFIQECHNLVELTVHDEWGASNALDACNILRAVESNPNLEELTWSWHVEDTPTLDYLLDPLVQSLPNFGPRFRKLRLDVPRCMDDNIAGKVVEALSCNCALESLIIISPYYVDLRFESCLYKNKMRRQFLVKTNTTTTTTTTKRRTDPAMEADATTTTTTSTTRPALLPCVLATVSQQPCSASVRYHVLRQNVHAFVGTLLSSAAQQALFLKRKRAEG